MDNTVGLLRRISLFSSFALTLALAGCGIGTVSTETAGSLSITGSVHGGIQPITGASLQLFAVGTSGNGSQASSLLTNPIVTDSHGYFTITGDYHCPYANSQIYLAARGGNPGFTSNVNNAALVLLSALGNCGNLQANPNRFIALNEVSTVAAVYALAPFMTAFDHVGASATNSQGITNAFLDAQLLVDPSTGMAATLPANLSIESGKLYALADVIVPCVNSDGGTACAPLFKAATPKNGTAPTDVLGALLAIVKHPGSNVGAVYKTITSTPPYSTTLTAVPNDWTMSLTVTGGGLVEPTQLAVDQLGNVWSTNFGDPGPAGVVAFSPQGTPFPGSPFAAGLQTDAYGLTLDKNGDAWVTSRANMTVGTSVGSVAKIQGANSSSPGAVVGQFRDSTISYPESIASDPSANGTVLIGNYYTGVVTVYDLNGRYLRTLGVVNGKFPVAVTSDNKGGAWVGNQGDNDIIHLFANGSIQDVYCCTGAQAVKLDRHENVWVSNFFAAGAAAKYSVSEVAANGSVLLGQKSGGGLNSPGAGAVDAGGQFWVANYYGLNGAKYGTFSEIAGNDTTVTAGSALTPTSGLGLDAKMSLPYSIVPDASGNLWVAVRNGDSLRMFFGMATPTATPATPIPQAP